MPVDHIDVVFGMIVHIDSCAAFFERHRFECVPVNLDISSLLPSGCIDDAEHRVCLMDIPSAVVDVQVVCCRIISNRICVLQEFHAREETIGGTVENLYVSRLTIRSVQPPYCSPPHPTPPLTPP